MATLGSRKKLLRLWMVSHHRLGGELQREFLNYSMVNKILSFEYQFVENAILRERKKLLSEILESVERQTIERQEFLKQRIYGRSRSYLCTVCNSAVIGADCLCRTAA